MIFKHYFLVLKCLRNSSKHNLYFSLIWKIKKLEENLIFQRLLIKGKKKSHRNREEKETDKSQEKETWVSASKDQRLVYYYPPFFSILLSISENQSFKLIPSATSIFNGYFLLAQKYKTKRKELNFLLEEKEFLSFEGLLYHGLNNSHKQF